MLKQRIKKALSCFFALTLMTVGIEVSATTDDSNIFDGKVKDLIGSSLINKNSKNTVTDDYYSITVSNTNLMGVYYPTETLASLTGNVIVEARMKFSSVTGVVQPIAVYGKDCTTNNIRNYGYSYMLYVENGSFKASNPTFGQKWRGANTNTLGEAKADTFYTVKVLFNVDGNAETADTYYYSVSNDEGVLYTNYDTAGYNIGVSDGGNTYNFYDMTEITGIVFGASKTANMTVTYDYVKAYNAAPVTVTSSLENGAVDVEGGNTIELDFSDVMNTDTFKNIKLIDQDGKEVNGLKCDASENKKSCTLTLPELESLKSYKIVISNIMSENMIEAEEKTINFTSKKSNIILYKNLSAMNNSAFNDDPDVMAKHVSYGMEENVLVFTRKLSDGTVGAVRYPETGTLSLKDNLEIETRMKFNQVAVENKGTVYTSVVPITLMDKNAANNENWAYPFLLYIREGKLYAAMPQEGSMSPNGQEICEIEAGKFYTFKIKLSIDGDADTVDKYYYTVSDGENEYSNQEGYNIGASTSDSKYNLYNLTSITGIYFGANKTTDMKMWIDYVKITELPTPTVTSSMKDGENDVLPDEVITLIFSEAVRKTDFDKIKIYCGETEVTGLSITPNDTLDACTVKVQDGFKYNRAYELVIPAMITQSKLAVPGKEIKFTTIPKPMPISISDVMVNDGGALDLSEGATVKINAKFKNSTDSEQSGCIIAGIYNSDNKLQRIAFSKQILPANASDTEIELTATVPAGVGEDGYIRVFGWDSLEGMNAGIDMIVFSSNNG